MYRQTCYTYESAATCDTHMLQKWENFLTFTAPLFFLSRLVLIQTERASKATSLMLNFSGPQGDGHQQDGGNGEGVPAGNKI